VILVAILVITIGVPVAVHHEVLYGRGYVNHPVVALGETTERTPWMMKVVEERFSELGVDVRGMDRITVTAAETNRVAARVTGRVYGPNQIVSCAAILPYDEPPRKYEDVEGYRIYVGPEITVCTPKMYADALASVGAPPCCVVIRSPVRATGEAALAGVYAAMRKAGVQVGPQDARFSQAVLEAEKAAGPEPKAKAAALIVVAVAVYKGADSPEKVEPIRREVSRETGVNVPEKVDVYAAEASKAAEQGAGYSRWWLLKNLLRYYLGIGG